MSEVLDRIENRGREQGIKQGEMRQAKKVAFRMVKKGIPIEDIAEIVEQDVCTVSLWVQNIDAETE